MSNTAPETPNQRAIIVYDDANSHTTDEDTVWTYNGCTFKRITKKEADGNIVELRNGGILSCPICPEIGVMTTLSNLVGHLVAKNHAQRFYHLWSLRGTGNNNAGPMLLFQESWETANHLKFLRSKRLEKVDKTVLTQNDYTWEQLKTRFNYITETSDGEVEGVQPGQFFMPGFDMFQGLKGIDGHIGGAEWKNMASVRTTGQRIVTSVFRQAKDKVNGVKGPLSDIAGNQRKRRICEEDIEQNPFKVPRRPYIGGNPDIARDQGTTEEGEIHDIHESSKHTNTLGIQFPWTDEQVAQAKFLKAKLTNSEELTPQEEEIYKANQQLYFLMDSFQGMETGQPASTQIL
ncbi:hypothetical protein TWF281_000367 [Arthrobotrys megalospora]